MNNIVIIRQLSNKTVYVEGYFAMPGYYEKLSNAVVAANTRLTLLSWSLQRKHNMETFFVLQVSKAPTQFRITVAQNPSAVHVPIDDPGWTMIGLYSTPEELEAALTPYLHLEQRA